MLGWLNASLKSTETRDELLYVPESDQSDCSKTRYILNAVLIKMMLGVKHQDLSLY